MTFVYYAKTSPLMNDIIFEAHRKSLPDLRRQKTDRLKFRCDKNLSIASWLVLRRALLNFESNPDIDGFDYDAKGKPFLKNRPDIYISISHSESIALCAVSDRRVGADIEYISQFKESVCRRFFGKNECRYVFDAETYEEQNDRFFEIWVLKESFVKYTGNGIGEFGKFEISRSMRYPEIKHCDGMYTCRFYEPEIDVGYKAAICLEDSDDIEICRVNIIKGLL